MAQGVDQVWLFASWGITADNQLLKKSSQQKVLSLFDKADGLLCFVPRTIFMVKKYIALANQAQLYALVRHRDKTFAIKKVQPDDTGIIESYHPSYTFKYGNTTKFI